ncbi:Alpha carbonic anhydrase [Actinidia chinensis var. chinensis]|uniref:Alpha carbonic anhydrase n=1 Tax=Actinidia chinensis var. chinensis TaxID=1590841 RepID=A0A2R6R7P3_ACTCC|nr:Alpha carbonic anhydrase [Actinidia chinensis var. chinensis]
MAARIPFFSVAIALLLLHTNAANEESPYPKFGYVGDIGPEKWGSLHPEFATCSGGKLQSPIDIVTDKAVLNKQWKPLKRDYHPVNATLVNAGKNIEMQFGNAGVLSLDDKNYTLVQMHWHTPSEHTLDGVVSDAELHLVHKASDGSLTVIAILYKIGDADPLLAKVQKQLVELAKEQCESDEEAQIPVGSFPVSKLRRNTRKYYRYIGSLTTPPCTENVIFNIFTKVRSMSKQQVEALKAPLSSTYKSNARPVQPLNGRQVELFDELS